MLQLADKMLSIWRRCTGFGNFTVEGNEPVKIPIVGH